MNIITHCKSIEERQAFMMGYAFVLGVMSVRGLAFDANTNNPYWVTTKSGHHYLIDNNGYIQSGRFKNQNVGTLHEEWQKKESNKFSSHDYFTSPEIRSFYNLHPEHKWKSYKGVLKEYLKNKYSGTKIKSPKGLSVAKIIKFDVVGLSETAARLKSNSDWVLEKLPEIYTKGRYLGSAKPSGAKHSDVKNIHYTQCIFEHNGEIFKVIGNVLEKKGGKFDFVHYAVKPIQKIK